MKSFMFAALNSESCIRRSTYSINFNPDVFCDPLGDRNIHWPVGPMDDNVKSVIMVIAKLDANSLYENLVPGAGSTITGLVTLLAAATYLHYLNATVNGKCYSYVELFLLQINN
jgi:nicastrin